MIELTSQGVVLLGWFVLALVVSASMVPVCRMIAIRYGYVALPREDRWHRKPIPLLGGVGIAVTAVGLAVISGDIRQLSPLLAVGGLICAIGVVDDIISLKPSTKLIAEIALAAVFVVSGYRLHWATSLTVDTLLSMVWLVGITNAFNLLDNMDGLCAGIALVTGLSLVIGLITGSGLVAETRYLVIILGATGGFLIFNLHPASIFLGDGGSLFLGMTLAAVTLIAGGPAHDRSKVLTIVVAPVLVLLIPIFDTTLVTVSRLLSGRSVAQGGRDHSSHRLVAIGLSERSAVSVLWVLAAAAGGIGFAVRRFSDDWAWLLGAIFVLAVVLFAAYLAQVRVYDQPAKVLETRAITPLVVNFMYKRRVAEVLLDVCLVTIAYYAAWRIRFDGTEWPTYFGRFLESLPLALAIQLVALFLVGAYRGAWRFFGLMDGVVFAKAVGIGTLSLIAVIVYLYRFENYSRSVFVIYSAFLMLILSGSRASFRLIAEFVRRRQKGRRLVIYGAGEAGSLLVRELMGDPAERYRMMGFIDDDPTKLRLRLQGYIVLGGESVLLKLIRQREVEVVVISSRQFEPARLEAIERACEENQIRLMRFHFRLESLVSCA